MSSTMGAQSNGSDFTPYIFVEGELKAPSSITLFAVSGGHWNVIKVPEELSSLPLAHLAPELVDLMHEFLREYGGQCPFFGQVRGFRFVRRHESFRFTEAGRFIGRDEGTFRRPYADVTIGSKTVASLFG
ncbi:MAG: hypothetical protein LLG20_15660 [Acidobacteriales bacterium]|nr:hypothetical protein [Terriglobales bacterium]